MSIVGHGSSRFPQTADVRGAIRVASEFTRGLLPADVVTFRIASAEDLAVKSNPTAMGSDSKTTKFHERIEKSQAAIERFARMAEEYRSMRKELAPGAPRERLNELIKLNEDTAALIKRSLVIKEGDLCRQERNK
jgi:hypothetical protein